MGTSTKAVLPGDAIAPLRLSDSQSRVLSLLGAMPMASVSDLSFHADRGSSAVYRSLWQLSESGLVTMLHLGATKQAVARWWVTPEGMSYVDFLKASWNFEGSRVKLLERLPVVEWIYPATQSMSEHLGRMEEFRWFEGVPWDAAARYERGWAMFMWIGLMQTEYSIRDLFISLGPELQECTVFGGSAWPSFFCLIVSDWWQRDLVLRVAASFGIDRNLRVICVSDGSVAGVNDPGISRGWIDQVYSPAYMGNWSWEERVSSSFWTSMGGPRASQIMDLSLEWIGLSADFGRVALGETGSSLRVQRLLKRLTDARYLRREFEDGAYRHAVDFKGFDILGRRDRAPYNRSSLDTRLTLMPHERGLSEHEEGTRDVVSQFIAAGLRVVAGWRSWEHLGGGGGIAPDAVIYLTESPYGPGWHYLEYERRARGRVRAERKLRGYGSPRRRDKWPVLFVVWDSLSEHIYQSLGRESRIKLITTTIRRLAAHDVVGSPLCWSIYGQPVALG